jgi:hypothetical protein
LEIPLSSDLQLDDSDDLVQFATRTPLKTKDVSSDEVSGYSEPPSDESQKTEVADEIEQIRARGLMEWSDCQISGDFNEP